MRVRLETSRGNIVIEMLSEEAPLTVENFLEYVRDGFYDGTIFHRVIDGFMIQGGGFAPGMHQKQARDSIRNEASNGVSNVTGTVAMARTADPHSASAQFFINANDNDFLDFKSEETPQSWGYCVFARVVEGLDVVTAIEESATTTRSGHQDVPTEDVVIARAMVVEE